MRGNQVCKNERSYPLSMGDTEELKKYIFFYYTDLEDKVYLLLSMLKFCPKIAGLIKVLKVL